MPILAKRAEIHDRRSHELGAPNGMDRRRCIERRKRRASRSSMSDAQWREYLEMPNLLELPVEVPRGLQLGTDDMKPLVSPRRS